MAQTSSHSLRDQQHPLIRQLAHLIESTWHQYLRLDPYDAPTDLGYIEGTLEGERLIIENHCYQTIQFRKLHLELAKVGNNLDILHCVMFPQSYFQLPIFGVDIVAGRDLISAAIVDLSPVSPNHALPTGYDAPLRELPATAFIQPRTLPPWGDIFSDFCLFVRPNTPEEENVFLNRVGQYLSIHCQLAADAIPTDSVTEQASIAAGQRRYCLQQQKNDKTRRILERAFGAEWAERYLQTMLFDCAHLAQNEESVTKYEVLLEA